MELLWFFLPTKSTDHSLAPHYIIAMHIKELHPLRKYRPLPCPIYMFFCILQSYMVAGRNQLWCHNFVSEILIFSEKYDVTLVNTCRHNQYLPASADNYLLNYSNKCTENHRGMVKWPCCHGNRHKTKQLMTTFPVLWNIFLTYLHYPSQDIPTRINTNITSFHSHSCSLHSENI